MSFIPDDWFDGFWPFRRRGLGTRRPYFDDMFRGMDETRRQLERQFQESFKDIEKQAPKNLIKEYETSDGNKVREVGPIVYGYSMTVGPDGVPKVKEFGNIKSPMEGGSFVPPMISAERKPFSDVTSTDKEVKVVMELPGVSKENIKINAYDNTVEVTSTDPKRKFNELLDIPKDTDIETAKSTYNNGILELTFSKKKQAKPKGKEIKID